VFVIADDGDFLASQHIGEFVAILAGAHGIDCRNQAVFLTRGCDILRAPDDQNTFGLDDRRVVREPYIPAEELELRTFAPFDELAELRPDAPDAGIVRAPEGHRAVGQLVHNRIGNTVRLIERAGDLPLEAVPVGHSRAVLDISPIQELLYFSGSVAALWPCWAAATG
jgi:hypothetical protein